MLLLLCKLWECYDSRLRVKSRKEPYIRLTQENSIEFLLQTSLSYIL